MKCPPKISSSEFSKFKNVALNYLLINRVLYRRQGTNLLPCHVIPTIKRQRAIMQSLLDSSGYRGREGTCKKVEEQYWWPPMYRDIREWCKTCSECQSSIYYSVWRPMHSISVSVLWRTVGLDITYMPETVEGYKYIVILRGILIRLG
jgi:hypothetical protein